ncbi:unnamed protein product [Amoebophrya sp. A25]|nr:unnamed protein product [Amoebophrya sp. A25]|eukprot:GSA25T00026246001.1
MSLSSSSSSSSTRGISEDHASRIDGQMDRPTSRRMILPSTTTSRCQKNKIFHSSIRETRSSTSSKMRRKEPRSSRKSARSGLVSSIVLTTMWSSLQSTQVSGEMHRLLMIPDIHGDFDVMQEAVKFVEPIHPGKDKLIFTGDLVDRGPQPQECYRLSQKLKEQYNVTRLTGNHEWITIMGVDANAPFAQYVPREDLMSFGSWSQRMHSFGPTGELGKMIREEFDVISLEQIPGVPLSKTLFVHAGITHQTLRQYGSVQAVKEAGKAMLMANNLDTPLLNEILQTRHLAQGQPRAVCREVQQILRTGGAERLVVGHTPTPLIGGEPGKPLIKCGGRLLLMDVAMSKWMGGGTPAALIFEAEKTGKKGTLKRIYVKIRAGEEIEVPILSTIGSRSTSEEEKEEL